jgi:hypothetical protein
MYLPENRVTVPKEELIAALEEGKSLLRQCFTLLQPKFEVLCEDLGNHSPFNSLGTGTGAVCVH